MEREPVRRWMICAACGYPLELLTGTSTKDQTWMHSRADQDHEIVPVDAASMEFKSRCDFCDREGATDVILADSFTSPGTRSRSVGHWAACEQCAEMVSRRRWSQLVTYVKQSGGTGARKAPRALLLSLYASLEQHMQGVITMKEWKERSGYPLYTD